MTKPKAAARKPAPRPTTKATAATPVANFHMPLVHELRDPLPHLTGYSRAAWLRRVQDLIEQHTTLAKGAVHGETDARAWLVALIDEVLSTFPGDNGDAFDGNLRAGMLLSSILTLWYARLHRAKSMDPLRPAALRRRSYQEWLEWSTYQVLTLLDERSDAAYFPGQEWDPPFTPTARSGDFV